MFFGKCVVNWPCINDKTMIQIMYTKITLHEWIIGKLYINCVVRLSQPVFNWGQVIFGISPSQRGGGPTPEDICKFSLTNSCSIAVLHYLFLKNEAKGISLKNGLVYSVFDFLIYFVDLRLEVCCIKLKKVFIFRFFIFASIGTSVFRVFGYFS